MVVEEVIGKIQVKGKGFGFVIPDERKSEDEGDVFVPALQMNTAMDGDRVRVAISDSPTAGHSREGSVVEILERANTRIVGTFERGRNFGFVVPDNTKLNQDIYVGRRDNLEATTGMKVVVEITRWPSAKAKAEGKIVEILGKAGEPGVDILSVMRQYDLSEEFPAAVQAEAEAIGQTVPLEAMAGRRDRRSFPIVTVDGDDAKDLDDGVYVEKCPDGTYFLGVYIADVSWYVREGHPLDKEAYDRGTSVYLVDRVVPMLPKELSNGICSLNAGVDRLSMACEMHIGADGQVLDYEILPVVIKVYRRLTYNIVNKVLVSKAPEFIKDQADILPMLQTLAELRHILFKKRSRRGSIQFEIPEVKVKLDQDGRPVGLVKRTGSLAESIIEECMLVANETVAEHMDRKLLPFIYRVHEQPKSEKLDNLFQLLGTLGLVLHKDREGKVKPGDIQRLLDQVAGRPEEKILSMVALRSMQQARYAAESLGHFGLAARYYTHFTSPIRRYPDLIVHRLLRETFATGTMPKERQAKLRLELPEVAIHASQRERIAVEAERATTDMKQVEYMAQFVDDEFDGVISSVTGFGMFVELENGVEGLVHVTSMTDDYYEYLENRFAMKGERLHKEYRLGDPVTVVLVAADTKEHTLDFVLKDNYVPGLAGAARGKKGRKIGKSLTDDRHDRGKKGKHKGKRAAEVNETAAAVTLPLTDAELIAEWDRATDNRRKANANALGKGGRKAKRQHKKQEQELLKAKPAQKSRKQDEPKQKKRNAVKPDKPAKKEKRRAVEAEATAQTTITHGGYDAWLTFRAPSDSRKKKKSSSGRPHKAAAGHKAEVGHKSKPGRRSETGHKRSKEHGKEKRGN